MVAMEIDYTAQAAAAVRTLRERHRLSQVQLAALAGYDHSHLSRVERGLVGITREFVERIGEALELTPYQFNRFRVESGYAPVRQRSQDDALRDG
jgi:transcriptional regulator with XRE-family HTH domain